MMTLSLSQNDALALGLLRACEDAALASADWVGKGDERAADGAAVAAMRAALNRMAISGRIVIGEGERDEAPMLFIGEEVGTGEGPQIDIALDPLEGTTLTAKAMGNALTVIAATARGGLLHAPDTYMDKLAIGPGLPRDLLDFDAPLTEILRRLAAAKATSVDRLGVCILERPRHQHLIGEARAAGAKVKLITDGDVAGVINTAEAESGVDLYVGQGGAPEGVLAAAALQCVGGRFLGRLVFRNDEERARADRVGIVDRNRVYTAADLASKPAVFVACGVTDGGLVEGVRRQRHQTTTESLIFDGGAKSMRRVKTYHALAS